MLCYLLALGLLSPMQERPEPPPGWYCQSPAKHVDEDHACACYRIDASDDCDGPIVEDPVCKVYCHHQHCRCKVHCEPKGSHANL